MNPSLKQFNPQSPILVLAPHLLFPLRNGGDIGAAEHWGPVSRFVPFVLIIGADTLTRYENGQIVEQTHFKNTFRHTKIAGFRALLKRSHYLIEKFLTTAYQKQVATHIQNPLFENVVCSHLWSTSLLPFDGRSRFVLIQTHNDDFQWFQHLANHATNFAASETALVSKTWTERFMKKNGTHFWFFHCTERDQAGYAAVCPEHRSFVMPVGVDVSPHIPAQLFANTRLHLIFTGALSVTMNFDALCNFRDRFYPEFKAEFGDNLDISVVGSSPSDAMKKLCSENGWKIFANVTDEELKQHFQQATFSLLPFGYATGSKLKLLKSLSFGVPFLSTNHASPGALPHLPHCIFSDNPENWISAAKSVWENGITTEERKALLAYAHQFSWPVLAEKMFEQLKRLQT